MSADSTFETLHRTRIRGLAQLNAMGDVTELVDASLLLVTDHGCMLTPAGLARHEELLAEWRQTADLATIATAYERFLAVNQPMKDMCSDWSRSQSDAEALFLALDSLGEIVQRVKPALHRAAQAVPRFASYPPRLETALEAAAEGDERFITNPRVDCVHNIWFECHEDFLVTLGRDREAEGSF
jgi:hypothetical protein